jgi:hypothetical protein
MKLLLLALVAVASAEPDAAWPYTTYAAGTYSGLYNAGLYNTGLYNPYNQVYGVPAVNSYAWNRLYKRDADAEPVWPVAGFYGQPAVYNNYWHQQPYVYRAGIPATVSQPVLKQGEFHTNLQNALKGIHTAPVGQVYQSTFNTVVKRDAESDAHLINPYVNTYSGLYGVNAGVYGVNAGFYNYPSVASPAVYPTVANTFYNGLRYVKREAEADSDAFVPSLYNTGYYPYSNVYANAYTPYVSTYANNAAAVYPYNTVYSGLRYW